MPGAAGVSRGDPAGGVLRSWTVDVRCMTSVAKDVLPHPFRTATSALSLFPRTHSPSYIFQNTLKNIPCMSVCMVNCWERAVA